MENEQIKDTTSNSYTKLFCHEVFTHSWGFADSFGAFMGVVLPPIAGASGWKDSVVNELAWQIPLCSFIGLVIVRVVLAPKWIRDRESKLWASKLEKKDDEIKGKNKEIKGRGKEIQGLLDSISALKGELRLAKDDRPQFSIDYAPKGPGFALLGIRLLVKTNAKEKTIHNVSVTLVEYNQIPEEDSLIDHTNEQLYFVINDDGHSVDLEAGREIRVPFVEFNQGDKSIRVLSYNKCWYGNGRGAMYRAKVMVTGENIQPASAIFVIGFNRKDIAFFNRIEHTVEQKQSDNQS